MKGSELTQVGYYWYFPDNGDEGDWQGEPQVVELWRDDAGLEALFTGSDVGDLPENALGDFIGPLVVPLHKST